MSKNSLQQLAPLSTLLHALMPDTYGVNLSERSINSVDP